MRIADETLYEIADRCAWDTDFRQRLLSDPKATIGREYGIAIPQG